MVLALESRGKERRGMNITHLAKQGFRNIKLAKLISKDSGENHQMAK